MDTGKIAPSMGTLPMELLMTIARHLRIEDFVSLRASCRDLRNNLGGSDASHDYDRLEFTPEANLAPKGSSDYATVIQRVYLTKMRFYLSKPYSAVLLGHGAGFHYNRDGMLAYVHEQSVRILDVYNAGATEDVVDVRSLLAEEAERWPRCTLDLQEILSGRLTIGKTCYENATLSMVVLECSKDLHYLVVVNTRKHIAPQNLVLQIRECHSEDPVLELDGRYMIVAERIRGPWPYDRWMLECYDSEDPNQTVSERLLPHYIQGCDQGRDIDFKIYDHCLYVLTTSHYRNHVEGPNESYYYCYRIPIEISFRAAPWTVAGNPGLPEIDKLPHLEVIRVERKEPRPPPTDDGPLDHPPERPWQDLSLRREESSGQLVIVEGWQNHGSGDDTAKAQYTFQPLVFPVPWYAIKPANTSFDDIVQTLNLKDLPRAKSPCECPRYTVVQVKKRAYNPRASAFLDLFLGSNCSLSTSRKADFRLAVGSNHCVFDIAEEASQLREGSETTDELSLDIDNERRFRGGVHRFPPNGSPEALLGFLCATGEMDSHTAEHDPRSIIYTTRRSLQIVNYSRLVLLNFDPWIRFPGLKTMQLHPLSDYLTFEEYCKELASAKQDVIWTDPDNLDKFIAQLAQERALWDSQYTPTEIKSPWLRTERAQWMDLQQGYQLI